MTALALGLAAAALLLVVIAIAAALALELRRRRRELERQRPALEGRLVIANTPKPDDQTIRGVVVRELEPRGLVLAGAVYLERELERGRETVREAPAGDVVIPVYAFAQIVTTPEA